MDYSLPGSSIHGIFQATVLEWGAIAFYHCVHLFCIKGTAQSRKLLGDAQRLVWAAKQALGNAALGALFA